MSINIRTATAADISAMHAVRSKVRENRLADPQRITEASYLPYVSAESIWVAETDTGIAGFAALCTPEATVWALFVAPDAEGAGIGRALHQRMLGWAHEQGIPRLFLSTQDGSRAARFYQRAGWTVTGTTSGGEALFEKILLSYRPHPPTTDARRSS